MEKSYIYTDHTMKETTEHGTKEFPISTSVRFSFAYNMGIAPWHWHDDFELAYIVSGKFEYSIGQETYIVPANEAIFINSKVLHQVKPIQGESPTYFSYVFSPDFLCNSPENLIYQKYISPLIQNRNFSCHIWKGRNDWEKNGLQQIHLLNETSEGNAFAREFKMQTLIQSLFLNMIEHIPDICHKSTNSSDNDSSCLMKIMVYVNEHYKEPITLGELADAANVSKSSLNRIFRKTLKMTPFEYLLEFRINQSLKLLSTSNNSITDIASSCGFRDISYFCKVFKEHKGMSPQGFRKKARGEYFV